REWMSEIGERKHVGVAGLGKIKTIVQMVAISFLLWREPIAGIAIYLIGQWLLFAAAFLTIWSAGIYMRAAWPVIRARDD
ncbi:MAG: CDP-alcohol phosphatidyltransferase family protein, partial [Saprospiraceae bacterium]